ncbi:MAG: DNA polymerase III subunit gamma/tau [Candidatus Latescibacteria bacterium]|nr:DNA polymerase III subunit gamma/tau [Candidatus Latescibacterota bacterium]
MPNYQVLTLKYRPQTLEQIWIQEHIKTTLTKAIENNRVAHAYLFTGPRGVGKTTTARILAKSLNCASGPTITPCQQCSVCREITASQNMDVLEIDGASNRGIDQVRELRENVKFMPTSCPYKIYIIDEVHMLTQEAFNALLKTLEEPPAHVKFIFATTAAQKVPATIVSRCQRFDFRKATSDEIVERLSWISKQEQITISEDALRAVSKRADGSIRDAEGMLDQLRVFKSDKIELKDVEDLLGIISADLFFEYTDNLLTADPSQAVTFIDRVFSSGYDFIEFFTGLLEHFRLLMMTKLKINKTVLGISEQHLHRLVEQAKKFNLNELLVIMQHIADNEEIVKKTNEPKILFEILSLNLINILTNKSVMPTNNTSNKNPQLALAWQNVVSEFLTKHPFSANGLQHAVINESSPDNIVITLDDAGNSEFIESKKSEIENMLAKQLGKPVKINFVITKKSRVKTNPGKTAHEKSDNDEDIESEPAEPDTDTDQLYKTMFPKGKKIK